MARPQRIRLGDLLVKAGLISPAVLESALAEQKRTGRRLGRILIDAMLVSEEAIARALADQLGLPYIDLKREQIEPSVLRLLPEQHARRLRVIPLRELPDQRLLIGMADPDDLYAFDEASRLTQRELQIALVTESDLLAAFDRHYRATEEIHSYARAIDQSFKSDQDVLLKLMDVEAGSPDAPVVRLIQTLFDDAVAARASDIHIEPQEKKLVIRFRIDGVLHPQAEAELTVAQAIAMRLKIVSGLDISEKRLPQDGRFQLQVRGRPLDVRLSILPTQYGESLVMRLLNYDPALLELERLNMPADVYTAYRRLLDRPHGLILVTGPTGSGKTTTLYASLAALNSVERKIITVEDPVEYRLPGVMQVQINDKIELTFARALRSILRQDPDIVLVGEMRDAETAQIGLRAAMTGHLVFSTLHTNDAASTPVRLIDMGAPRFMVATSLLAVLAQRLLRRICPQCSRSHQPTAAERQWLAAMGHSGDGHWRVGSGCPHCHNTGYLGRLPVHELLEMTPELMYAANHDDPQAFLRLAHETLAGRTLGHRALALAAAGQTTLDEAMRVAYEV
ncbi:MAG: GspE/PulE family protein [Thiobacillaceae bacterium]|nr:GspE/PulE family protein [Thiobacillaceae bacterium]